MARPFTGNQKSIDIAQMAISQATMIDELQRAQTVLPPLLFGLSLAQTARD